MRPLRAGLIILYLAIITPPFALIAILTCMLPALWRYHIIGQWNNSVLWGLRVIAGITYQVRGQEHLPKTPCVFCAKHQSAWETIAFYAILPPCGFVIKRSLLLIPFFGWGLKIAMAPIPIDRSSPQAALRSVLTTGSKRLQQGFSVVIFPEGTRTPIGTHKEFLPSAPTLAKQAQVPLVPIALNSGKCWPSGKMLGFDLHPGEITVVIGEPIATENKKSREILAAAQEWIVRETDKLVA